MSTADRSHYEVLGVAPDATEQEIKGAYRRLAKTLHPDMPTGSQALFGVVCEAYEVLSDPVRRKSYDRGQGGGAAAGAGPGDSSPGGASSSSSTGASAAGHTNSGRSAGPSGNSNGAGARPTENPADGPFSRAYAAAAAGQPYTSPWPSGPSPRQAYVSGPAPAPAPARRPGPPSRGRGGSIAWWTLPLVLAVTFALGLLRFTGLTAAMFGVENGDPLMFGRTWEGTPALFEDGAGSTAFSGVVVAMLCAGLVAGFLWRKRLAPTPRAEKIALLVAWAVLVVASDFVLTTVTAWFVLFVACGVYATWLLVLYTLPSPGSTEQWESFPDWIKAVRVYRTQQAELRTRQRQTRKEQRRAKVGEYLHRK